MYSSSSNILIDNMANPFNLPYDIIDFRYEFINFNHENFFMLKQL